MYCITSGILADTNCSVNNFKYFVSNFERRIPSGYFTWKLTYIIMQVSLSFTFSLSWCAWRCSIIQMSLSFTNINYIRTILPFQLREKNKYHNNLQAYVTLYWWSQVWLLSLPCNYIVISNFQIKYIEIPFNLIGKTLLDADHIIKRYQNFIQQFFSLDQSVALHWMILTSHEPWRSMTKNREERSWKTTFAGDKQTPGGGLWIQTEFSLTQFNQTSISSSGLQKHKKASKWINDGHFLKRQLFGFVSQSGLPNVSKNVTSLSR